MNSQAFIRTDEDHLSVAALREVLHHIRAAHDDTIEWLWALGAMKLAFQTFLVASFGTARGLEAMPPKAAEQFQEAIRGRAAYPPQRMRPFNDLYKYAKERHRWEPGREVDAAIEKIVEIRNDLEHFLPKGWSIQLAGLPSVAERWRRAVAQLASSVRELPWHDEELRDECWDLIRQLEEAIEAHSQTPPR